MSPLGQYAKSSLRADVFRFAPNIGRYSAALGDFDYRAGSRSPPCAIARRMPPIPTASGSLRRSCRPTCAARNRSRRLLPILYLKGNSTGDFSEALAELLRKDANGPIGAALTARSSNYFPRSQAAKATGAGMGPVGPPSAFIEPAGLPDPRGRWQCAPRICSELSTIVLQRETISRGAIIWLAMAAWTTLLPASCCTLVVGVALLLFVMP